MNKQIIFYLLTALIVLTFKTDSSYSLPTTKNTTDSSKDTKTVQPFERKFDANTKAVTNDDQPKAFTVGMLFIPDGDDFAKCTASVINTGSGNIGVTAGHCLYDHDTNSYYENVLFSPGYDHGQEGPLGKIPIAKMVVPNEFINNNDNEFDWGMMLFDFNLNGQPLKFYTGALGYTLQRANNIPTTIQGYPDGGNLENCPNDGQTLCMWQGVTTLEDDFYTVQDLNLGAGASGSPLMANYDPNVNLGILYSNYASFDEINDQLLAPLYDPIEFQALIGELEL